MSIVSNLASTISPTNLGGKILGISNVDLNDTTFSDLLEKQIGNNIVQSVDNVLQNFGMPAGFDIQPMEGLDAVASNLTNFARKQAANFYDKYSRSVVTDIKEFVEDTALLS